MGITRKFGEQYRKPKGIFGRIIGRQMNRHHLELTRWALDALKPAPGHSALDLGCGAGMGIEQLAEAVADGSVTGIDYSDDMVAAARKRNANSIAERRVTIKKADISEYPFEPESYNRILSIESFFYWTDYARVLSEILCALKPGGRLVIVLEWSKDVSNIKTVAKLAEKMNCPLHSGDEIAGMLRQAGFSSIRKDFEYRKNWLLVSGDKHG